MVLFLRRNKSSRNGTKLCRTFYINKGNFWSQESPEGGTWVDTTHQGAPAPQARPGGLSPPGGPADPETDAIKSYFSSKKIREKELSRSKRRSRRHLLFFIGRPDVESVWGSGEGDLRSSPALLHRQFHDSPHRE